MKRVFSFWQSRGGGLGLYLILTCCGCVLALALFFPEYFYLEAGIYDISCREIRANITAAVEEYNAVSSVSIIQPNKRVDLDLLKEKGFLRDVRNCPKKGSYYFTEDGLVKCTVHGYDKPSKPIDVHVQ